MSEEQNVKKVYRFVGKVSVARVAELLGAGAELALVRRIDYHDDGSETVTHYLELDEARYERLAVLFADVWREPRPAIHVRPVADGWEVSGPVWSPEEP